jgi:GNAT superfamily N-acetyltransferase
MTKAGWTFHPLTAKRWPDFEALFGPRGACAGCWCLWWYLPRSQWQEQKGDGNREAMRRRVLTGPPPGLLAYDGEEAVAWCALAPREETPALARSRILKPVDGQPVWSLVCFFVRRSHRNQGLTVALLNAAADYASTQGARILEGYPTEPATSPAAPAFIFTGIASAFRKAGFQEVARRSPTRPIFRRELG